MDPGERRQTHGETGSHRVIARALLFHDEVVIVLAVLDPLDHTVVERKIIVPLGFSLPVRRPIADERWNFRWLSIQTRAERCDSGKNKKRCHDQQQYTCGPPVPAGEAIPRCRF